MTELPAGRVCRVYGHDCNASTPRFVQHDSPPFHHFLFLLPFFPRFTSRNEESPLFPERSSRFPRDRAEIFHFRSQLSLKRNITIRYISLFSFIKNISKNFSRKRKRKGWKGMASRPSFYILSLLTATRITNFRVLPRSRVSYARQIAVMTVHRGKKCHVRGKQNVSRAYVLSSLSSSHPLLTSSPLLAHTARRCL